MLLAEDPQHGRQKSLEILMALRRRIDHDHFARCLLRSSIFVAQGEEFFMAHLPRRLSGSKVALIHGLVRSTPIAAGRPSSGQLQQSYRAKHM
jgi:hypothetical protein